MAIRGTPRCNLKVYRGDYTSLHSKRLADSRRGRPLIGKLSNQLKLHLQGRRNPWVQFPLPFFYHNNKQQETYMTLT